MQKNVTRFFRDKPVKPFAEKYAAREAMHPEFKIMPSAAFASLVVNTYDNNSAHAFNAVSSSSTFVMLSLPFLSFSVPAKLQNRVAITKSESATSGANALLAFDKLLEDDALFSSCPKTEKFTPSASIVSSWFAWQP